MVSNEGTQAIDQTWHRHFSDPWQEHLVEFNQEANKFRAEDFLLPNRNCSPAWLNGDLERMPPGEWVLVISLNPHINPEHNRHEDRLDYTSEEWKEFWRVFNLTREHWSGNFFPRIGELASRCMGLELDREEAKDFVYRRMVLIEFCPYASRSLPKMNWNQWKSLAAFDPAIRISREVRQWLFDFGQPALVLCNGKLAGLDVLEQQLAREQVRYDRIPIGTENGQTIPVHSGVYSPKLGSPFNVVGFNQIGRQFSKVKQEMAAIPRYVATLV